MLSKRNHQPMVEFTRTGAAPILYQRFLVLTTATMILPLGGQPHPWYQTGMISGQIFAVRLLPVFVPHRTWDWSPTATKQHRVTTPDMIPATKLPSIMPSKVTINTTVFGCSILLVRSEGCYHLFRSKWVNGNHEIKASPDDTPVSQRHRPYMARA